MEGSTVSPPLASPTKGSDPCGIDVSSVAIHSVTLIACLCGLAGNGAVLWLLSLKNSVAAIFDLAFIDFLFLFFALPSALILVFQDVFCSPSMPPVYLSFLFQLSLLSYYWGLYRLTDINIAQGVSILCWRCCRRHLPQRLRWLLLSAQFWTFLIFFTVIPTVPSMCPSHQREQCRVAVISINSAILLLFAAPTVISRTIRFMKAKRGSQQQQFDRLDSVVFFIVLFNLPLILWNFLQQLSHSIVSSQVFFLLACIHSSIKPFICFSVGKCCWRCRPMGSSWRHCCMESLRDSLREVFEEPEENTPCSNGAAMDTAV